MPDHLHPVPGAHGVYGIALTGLDGARPLTGPAGSNWPELAIDTRFAREERVIPYWGADDGHFNLQGGGVVRLSRDPLLARFSIPEPVDDQKILHPFLAGTAAIVSLWHGRESFHAGAFERNGSAWVVIGAKGAGKSSTLAMLALSGIRIIADDLIVLDEAGVRRGPSCIDLRIDAATHLGIGEDLGVVGARERWRLVVESAPDILPLGGWILPEWGSDMQIVDIPLPERLSSLLGNLTLRQVVSERRFVDFAAAPTLRFVRPRDWSALPAAIDTLLRGIDQRTP